MSTTDSLLNDAMPEDTPKYRISKTVLNCIIKTHKILQ